MPIPLFAPQLVVALVALTDPAPNFFVLQRHGNAGPPIDVTRMLTADLNGDLHPDLISVANNQLFFHHGPGVYQSITDLGVATNDFAVTAAVTADGYDGLLAVGAAGAQRIHFDFDTALPSVIQHTGIGGIRWTGARRVVTGEIDAAGGIGMYGISADGMSILTLSDPWGAATDLPAIDSTSEILDITALDWNGDSTHEIATVTRDGFVVYRADGTVEYSLPLSIDVGFLLRLRQDGYGKDRVAAVGRPTGYTNTQLFVFDAQAPEVPLLLGDTDVYGGAVADLDNDGDDDVILTNNETSAAIDPIVFRNQSDGSPPGTAATFGWGSTIAVPLDASSAVAAQRAWPALADFTNDGDIDLAYFSYADQELLIAENNRIDHRSQLLLPNNPNSLIQPYSAQPGGFDAGDLFLSLLPPAERPEGFDHVLIQEWVQADSEIYRVGAYRFLRSLPIADWSQTIPLRLWDGERVGSQYILHLDVRLAHVEDDVVVDVGPTCIHSLAVWDPTVQWLEGYAASIGVTGAVTDIPINAAQPLGGSGSGSTSQQGLFDPPPSVFELGNATLGPGGGPIPKAPPHDDDGEPPVPPDLPPDEEGS